MGTARLHGGAAAVTAVAMLATPFAGRGGAGRRALSSLVVGGLFATTTAATGRRWGPSRAGIAATAVSAATGLIEIVGVRTGRPFGRYRYTDALQPQIAGVPVIVPLAWTAMAVPARETAHAALGARSNPIARVVAGAASLAAWDLFLDPQMVGEGYWRWLTPGRYRGIPRSNFVGWFVTGLAVMAALEVVLPPADPVPELVAEYGVMAAMETVAFGSFLADARVALTGGLAMVPVAALAVVRLVGQPS